MTKLPHIMSNELIEDALREQKTLIECRTIEHLPKVIDLFRDHYAIYILISHPTGKSLRQLMESLRVNIFPEGEVRKMLFGLLTIVLKLHKRGFKHGNITVDTVYTSRHNGRM